MSGTRPVLGLIAGVMAVALASVCEARPLRVMSLDQCADQYALALTPDQDLRLSQRADDPDSWMRQAARGHARVRTSLEQAVLFEPDVVLRTWGGDPRLIRRLEAQGATVVTLADVQDFDGARDNLRAAGLALGQASRADLLIERMDAKLGETVSSRGSALYLTSGGFTSGRGTFIDAILGRAGLRNAEPEPGFRAVSVERLVMAPPDRLVLGFFDLNQRDRRGPGRHPALKRLFSAKPTASLPGAVLTCPAWFAAEAVEDLRAMP